MFAGAYESLGIERWQEKPRPRHIYKTRLIAETSPLAGRLVVQFLRTGRQSYRNAETIAGNLKVHELKPEKLAIGDFPGYKNVLLSKLRLDTVVRQSLASWKAALENVAGVYLIADTSSGQLYVGSATGEAGIWQRWCDYSKTGHGGNADLRKLLKAKSQAHASRFQYSILEIVDTHSSAKDVLTREEHWKQVLRTREFGLNRN